MQRNDSLLSTRRTSANFYAFCCHLHRTGPKSLLIVWVQDWDASHMGCIHVKNGGIHHRIMIIYKKIP